MVFLIIAESSLELVPEDLQNHISVTTHAQKLKKQPSEILLDNSWHFAAMKGIKDEIKRGRPDLVHFCILEATTIPLYKQNKIKLYVHTNDNKVIYFGENVNIPKSYHRFEGLIEKLFEQKSIETEGKTLLKIANKSFPELINELKPSKVIGFSTKGQKKSLQEIASETTQDSCIVIGGFQKGHFSSEVLNRLDELVSLGNTSFEAHVIIARMLYEYEKTIFM